MDKFDFPVQYGFSVEKKPNINIVKFGDGYEQRNPAGLNSNLRTFSVAIKAKANKELYNKINAFLDEHGGYKAFLWKMPDLKGETVKVYCQEWTSAIYYGHFEVSMKFKETL